MLKKLVISSLLCSTSVFAGSGNMLGPLIAGGTTGTNILTPASIAAAGGLTNVLALTQIKQVAYQGYNFPNTNYNTLYVQRGDISNLDFTNTVGGLVRHFENDVVNGWMTVNTNVPANSDGSSYVLQWLNIPTINNSNSWVDDTGAPITGYMLRTNVTVTTLLPINFAQIQDSDVHIDFAKGNDTNAVIGIYPYFSDLASMLCSYATNAIIISGGFNAKTGQTFHFGLIQGQNISGAVDGSGVFPNGSYQLQPLVSNIVNGVTLLGGAQIEANWIANCTFRNSSFIETSGGSGDTFGVNILTNCVFENCTIIGYVDAFQGQTYGTNYIRNCSISAVAIPANQTSKPFFSATGTLVSGKGVWNISSTIITDDSTASSSPSSMSADIENNQTNAVYFLSNVALYHRGTTTAALYDPTASAIFNGTWTDNGTNMVGYGIAGKTGYPLVLGLSMPITVWTNTLATHGIILNFTNGLLISTNLF